MIPARTTPHPQPPPPHNRPQRTVQVEINNLPAPTERRRTKARRKLQQYEAQAGGKGGRLGALPHENGKSELLITYRG
jgi:hypothetical protein